MTEARTYTIDEAAIALGVGRRTLYDRLGEDSIDLGTDRIKVVRIGRRVLIPRDEVERILGVDGYAVQNGLKRELAVIRRGSPGSPSNIYRAVFIAGRQHGLSRRQAHESALAAVRVQDPTFDPSLPDGWLEEDD